MFVGMLRRLRKVAETEADKFASRGFTRFFAMILKEPDNEYFGLAEAHLSGLKFRNGVLIGAELGKGFKGASYMLRKANDDRRGWLEQLFKIADGVKTDPQPPKRSGA